jgi:hypothetical protein
MASASLLPVLGVAGIGLARAATAAIGEGLSFAAELMRGEEPPASTSVEQEPGEIPQAINALVSRIKKQLAAAGIDVTQPLTLTSDGLGGITAGDHPQRAAIEELLESDVLLLRDFERLKDEFETSAGPGTDFQLSITQPPSA